MIAGTSNIAKYFVYDGGNVVLDFVDVDGHLTGTATPTLDKRYFQGPGVDQLLAQERFANNVSQQVLWILPDHLGSTRDLVDTLGKVVAHYQYDSFGVLLDGRENVTRYQFTGCEHDSNTDLNYHRARWYDPFSGKWISEDPIGFRANDPNLSRMVANNVLNATDSSGESAIGNFIERHKIQQAGFCAATDRINIPLPNGFSFHVNLGGCIEAVRCCEQNDEKIAFKFLITAEGYFKWGYDWRDSDPPASPGAGGKKRRNDSVPDPWDPTKRTKRKRLPGKGQPAGPGFRDRTAHIDVGPGLPACADVPSWDAYGSLFLRGTVGAYFGGQFAFSKSIQTSDDLAIDNAFSNWSYQASAATGVYGASIEAGVGINVDIWFAKADPKGA